MTTYKLILAYEGTDFSGWQVQPNAPTIQALLEEKLSLFAKEPIAIVGAGRTDAGVHALGQVAHFRTDHPLDLAKTHVALNGMLPHAIRVLSIEIVADTFHARYGAKNKIYHYHITLDPVQSPFIRRTRLHLKYPFDLNRLKAAIPPLLGTHDFSSFANEQERGSAGKNPVRTLFRLDVVPEQGGIRLEFEGNSFLYKMVRNITGTLIEVGRGKRDPKDVADILHARDRRLAGKAAPAHGLTLVKIAY